MLAHITHACPGSLRSLHNHLLESITFGTWPALTCSHFFFSSVRRFFNGHSPDGVRYATCSHERMLFSFALENPMYLPPFAIRCWYVTEPRSLPQVSNLWFSHMSPHFG